MKTHLASLFLLLTASITFASHSDPISDFNKLISNQRIFNSCPGLDLVLTCGNGTCEANKNETKESCPADCVSAPVRSYNNQTLCTNVQKVFTPKTETEVQAIVREAARNHQHVKVIGKSHSANEILCSDGVVIATENLNQVRALETFEGELTVRTEPGATLLDLTEWLHSRGQSIGYSIMGFNGVSIAGAVGTGSHGSSVKHTSVISNIVKSVRLVDSDGIVHEYSEKTTPEKKWKAVKANFGLLGVITELRLKTRPQKNLKLNITYGPESDLFGKDAPFALVKDCDWGQISWMPGSRNYMKMCGVETNAPPQKGAHNRFIDPAFPAAIVTPLKQTLQYSACNKTVACTLEKVRSLQYKLQPPFEYEDSNGKMISSHELVGPSHRMMSSQLTPYQKGFFQMDWEIAVPKSKAEGAMKAVLDHIRKNNICLPLVGVFLRFAPSENQTLMAHTVSGGAFVENEPVVFIEMPVYLPTGFSQDQKDAYDSVYEEFAKMLIRDHGGRAHWGKNRDWIFAMQRDQGVYGENLKAFQEITTQMDPRGLFSNIFSQNLGIRYNP